VPEEVSECYSGAHQELLGACRLLVLAMVAAWRWDLDDQLPNGKRAGQELLGPTRRPTVAGTRRRDAPGTRSVVRRPRVLLREQREGRSSVTTIVSSCRGTLRPNQRQPRALADVRGITQTLLGEATRMRERPRAGSRVLPLLRS
jgi:hypothetical protein